MAFLDLLTKENDAFKQLASAAKTLIDSLKDKKVAFFYSLPIEPDGINYKIKTAISGETGFNDDIFNLFYIRVIPEAPTLIADLDFFLGPKITTEETREEEGDKEDGDEGRKDLIFDWNSFSTDFNNKISKETKSIAEDTSISSEEKDASLQKISDLQSVVFSVLDIYQKLSELTSLYDWKMKNLSILLNNKADIFDKDHSSLKMVQNLLNILGIKVEDGQIQDTPGQIIFSFLDSNYYKAEDMRTIMKNLNVDWGRHNETSILEPARNIKETYKKCN